MIRVTVELLPRGREAGKRVLGVAMIANDGTGTLDRGNYKIRLSKWAPKVHETWKRGSITNFDRKRRGPWDLIFRALQETVGDRNP